MIGRHKLEAESSQPFLSEEFTAALRGLKHQRPARLEEFWSGVDDKQWALNERSLSRIVGRPGRLQRPE